MENWFVLASLAECTVFKFCNRSGHRFFFSSFFLAKYFVHKFCKGESHPTEGVAGERNAADVCRTWSPQLCEKTV